MLRWCHVLVLVAGCNQVFGVQHTEAIPDAGRGPTDEDGDGFKNDVDNCPGIFNADQALDSDGDRVGDACDPHPTTTGDRIAALEMFSGPNYIWTPDSSANWTLAAGYLKSAPALIATTKRITLSVAAPQPTIELGFVIDDYTEDGINNIAIALNYSNDNVGCRVRGTSPGEKAHLMAVTRDGGTLGSNINITPPQEGAENQVRFWRTMDTSECLINGFSKSAATSSTMAGNLNAAVEVGDMQLSLAYIVIYAVD